MSNSTMSYLVIFAIMYHANQSNTAPVHMEHIGQLNQTNHISDLYGGCVGTEYGCCHDNKTFCSEKWCSNCNETNITTTPAYRTMYGGCEGTEYGCCHDNNTFCSDKWCSNCEESNITTTPAYRAMNGTMNGTMNRTMYGGCEGAEYGCCHDNKTFCSDRYCLNCKIEFSIY